MVHDNVKAAAKEVTASETEVASAEAEVASASAKVVAAEGKVVAAKAEVAPAEEKVAAAKAEEREAEQAYLSASEAKNMYLERWKSANEGVKSANEGVRLAQKELDSALNVLSAARDAQASDLRKKSQLSGKLPCSVKTNRCHERRRPRQQSLRNFVYPHPCIENVQAVILTINSINNPRNGGWTIFFSTTKLHLKLEPPSPRSCSK